MACSPVTRSGPVAVPCAVDDPGAVSLSGEPRPSGEHGPADARALGSGSPRFPHPPGESVERLDHVPLGGSVGRLDALAVAIAAALHRIARPLAIVASEACLDRVWTRLGYARAEDFARERLDRTGRWLRDMAALGRSSWSTDRLLAAVEGSDGKPPLGTVAAVAIARFQPSSEALPTWIALGRAVCVRELRLRLRQARAAGSHHPVDASGQPDLSLRPPDPIIEWMAQLSPESLSGPAFREAAALPWNRRYLESIGVRVEGAGGSDHEAARTSRSRSRVRTPGCPNPARGRTPAPCATMHRASTTTPASTRTGSRCSGFGSTFPRRSSSPSTRPDASTSGSSASARRRRTSPTRSLRRRGPRASTSGPT